MSHFTVMVIGDNPESLLEPYNENTVVEEYEVGPVPKERLEYFASCYREKYDEDINLSIDELYEKHGDDWNGGIWKKEGDEWVEYSNYNPSSKWDWYQLGGRWNGFFKLKPGAEGTQGIHYSVVNDSENRADSCKKGDIDVEGMMDEASNGEAERYDFVHSSLEGQDLNKHLPWEHFLQMHHDNSITIEEARELYHNQPTVKAFREAADTEKGREILGYFSKVEDFLGSREEFIQRARDSALAPFAVLTEDGWFERGEMGWWACVSNEKDPDEWNREFMKLWNELPDDTIINLVDCHI